MKSNLAIIVFSTTTTTEKYKLLNQSHRSHSIALRWVYTERDCGLAAFAKEWSKKKTN